MTQGITNSLNIVLGRMSAIESGFYALEKISNQLSSDAVSAPNSDFKAILDGKIQQAQVPDTNNTEKQNPIEPIDIKTQIENDIKENLQKDNKEEKIDNIEKIKEAINLKSKIDLQAQSANVEEIIETFSNQYNVDSDFIKAIIQQESGFNSNATSKKGAMGLMQLMPETAKSLGISDAYNPNENIEGGIKYLKGLLDRFDNNKELALAAYNAGPNAVKKYGGVPPYKETQNYVNAIMSAYGQLKNTKGEIL